MSDQCDYQKNKTKRNGNESQWTTVRQMLAKQSKEDAFNSDVNSQREEGKSKNNKLQNERNDVSENHISDWR